MRSHKRPVDASQSLRPSAFPGCGTFGKEIESFDPTRCHLRQTRHLPQFSTWSYVNEAGARDYMLFVPSTYAGQPLPLIVMLHGCEQDPYEFAVGTRMNRLAEQNQCLVAYPAQASTANRFCCWNWFNPGDQKRDSGEPSIIAGITKQIMADYCVDKRRVYIAGLSAGGSMAVIMGRTYPEVYAAVGVHSGLAYGRARDAYSAFVAMRHGLHPGFKAGDSGNNGVSGAHTISTIVFHGDMDDTVHPGNSDQVIAQSVSDYVGGVPLDEMRMVVRQGQIMNGHAYTQTIYQDRAKNAVAEQWLIHGAGHRWFGGSAAASFTDPFGPDAGKEMLRFFSSHPRIGESRIFH
jgi:poly(hydroxyalkanoate) depolymerase family esterase